MRLSHLFFDAAGTLIRVKEPVGVTYARMGVGCGLHAEAEVLEVAFRQAWTEAQTAVGDEMLLRDGDRAWWAKLVQRTFSLACESVPTGPLFEDLFDSLYQHYATAQAWEIYPEVVSVLEELRSQFTLHVLSNFDPRLLPVLEGLGIRQNFREVILSSEIGVRKPDSQLFVHALQRTGATPALAMHIGDEWLADIQGAQNAGWRTFHVRRPQVDLRGLREQVSTTPASDHQ